MSETPREAAYRREWLEKHKDASSLVFDEKTGVPHQAVYAYPASTIEHRETVQAFFAMVKALEDSD